MREREREKRDRIGRKRENNRERKTGLGDREKTIKSETEERYLEKERK